MRQPEATKYQKLRIFRSLSADAAREALSGAQLREVSAGEPLYQQDQPAKNLHVLAEGRMKLTRVNPEGRQLVVMLLAPGDAFGSAALHAGLHSEFAVAMVDSVALAWPASAVRSLVQSHPLFGTQLLESVGRHLSEAYERMGELASAPAERRVAHALLRLARVAGERSNGGVRIELPVSREDVAQMAGTTLYTVSRLMSGWEREGVLGLGRQRVVILDRDQLEALAQE